MPDNPRGRPEVGRHSLASSQLLEVFSGVRDPQNCLSEFLTAVAPIPSPDSTTIQPCALCWQLSSGLV